MAEHRRRSVEPRVAFFRHGDSLSFMRIRDKVALVGGIPIAIAAAIALIAWLLLSEAERARRGAVLAGAAYRDLASVTTWRDDYVRNSGIGRSRPSSEFDRAAERADRQLGVLASLAREQLHEKATSEGRNALFRYREQMVELRSVSRRNDELIGEMNARASRVITLADRARERQHQSNADIIASLTEGDRRLRAVRDIVDAAFELRAATAALEIERLGALASPDRRPEQALTFALARFRNAVKDVVRLLDQHGQRAEATELSALARDHGPDSDAPHEGRSAPGSGRALIDRVERLTKINSTEQRALHEEVAQLLTYSVQAAETEQATQNVAIATFKLARRADEALSARDPAATVSILEEAKSLSETMSALPISPLIQTEMIDAISRWREGLSTTADGLQVQNDILERMDLTAQPMIRGAEAINDLFTSDADRIGKFVQSILLLGAALGLLFGAGTAILVARSITRPLKQLEERMRALAANPAAGVIPEAQRRDELGAMARAANFFVTEIGHREKDLRQAKERTDAALTELKDAQANLIQAEKLASLGQLVAGVAHEINTPLGVALTTSTAFNREVVRLEEQVKTGRLARSEMNSIVARLREGGQLILSNLTRAIDLVYSFKQVAADRASGERRSFELCSWLDEVVTSLGPVLRKRGHTVDVECPAGLMLDSYPGALAQVLTNLIMNAITHAYPDGHAGSLSLRVFRSKPDRVRFVFRDQGVGISDEDRAKVFDPFFTTARERGSTGLGLHIVHNLVTATLQGRIDLESKPGQGTTFIVDLPAVADETPSEPLALSA